MWATVLGFYTLIAVGFVYAAVTDNPRKAKELAAMLWAALWWPLYHLPWRDFSEGKHRQRHSAGRQRVSVQRLQLRQASLV